MSNKQKQSALILEKFVRSGQEESKGGMSMRKSRIQSDHKLNKSTNNRRYNKYYISPRLQFRIEQDNPKNNKKILNNEKYVYENLRNDEFWNWSHPFQHSKQKSHQPLSSLQKSDNLILEGFKRYVEDSHDKYRLPSIVSHILSNKSRNE